MPRPPRHLLTSIARGAAAFGLCTAALLAATGIVFAGECPVGKTVASARQAGGASTPKGVTDTVLASIDLAREPAAIDGRSLRLRKLVIEPDGIVPWHSHENRPAIIYIVSGTVTEYASTCLVPIVHKAGDVAAETHATAHWWKNTGKQQAVLLSADLLPVGQDQHVM